MKFPEYFRVSPHIGMVDLGLLAEGVLDELFQRRGKEVGAFEVQDQKGRFFYGRKGGDDRFDRREGLVIPHRLLKDVLRSQKALVGSPLFRPPLLPQDVGHAAEIVGRFFTRRAGIQKAEYLRGPVGQNIHHNQVFGEGKGSATGIQYLNEAHPGVESQAELLAAFYGTIAASSNVFRGSAGQTAVSDPFVFMGNEVGCFDAECHHGTVSQI